MKLGKSTTMKRIIAAFIFAFVSSSVFAVEEYVSLIYKQIDTAFSDRKSDMLDQILSDNNGDRYYYLIENYAQKKIRRLILNNDYDFAKETTLVVIDNNLDNVDAVEMYSLIIESYEIQKEAERKRELAQQQEEERVEKEMEKVRGATEKTYVGASTADGKNVYLSSEKDMNFTRYEWKTQMGLVDYAIITGPYDSKKYGLNLSGTYEYSFVDFTVGADASFGVNLMPATGNVTMALPMEIDAKIALTQISRKIFLKAGFMNYLFSMPTGNETFASPFAGFTMDKIKIGPTLLSFGFEWYPAHLYNTKYKETMAFAGGGGVFVEIPFTELDKTKWYLSLGVKDKFIIPKNGDIDNRLHVILAVGGKNVVR